MPEMKIREKYKALHVQIRLVDFIVLTRFGIPVSPLIRELVSGYISRGPQLRDLKTYLQESATNRESAPRPPQGAEDPVQVQVQVQDIPHPGGSSLVPSQVPDQDIQDRDLQDHDQVDLDLEDPGPGCPG